MYVCLILSDNKKYDGWSQRAAPTRKLRPGNLTASFAVKNGYQLLIKFLFINRTSVFTIDAHRTAAVKQDSLTVDTDVCVLQVL